MIKIDVRKFPNMFQYKRYMAYYISGDLKQSVSILSTVQDLLYKGINASVVSSNYVIIDLNVFICSNLYYPYLVYSTDLTKKGKEEMFL